MAKQRMKRAERRQQIIDNACEVFAVLGLDGARTREIAEACGINEALLYKHFPSKKELFIEAMAHIHRKFLTKWHEQMENEPSGLAALRRLLELTIENTFKNPQYSASAFHAMAATTQDARMREAAADNFSIVRDFRAKLIKRGIEDGSLRSDLDPGQATLWLSGILITCIMVNALGLQKSFGLKDARQLLDDILSYMAAGQQV